MMTPQQEQLKNLLDTRLSGVLPFATGQFNPAQASVNAFQK
jgi:predicted negative regulator of RcsB-dependent stress response